METVSIIVSGWVLVALCFFLLWRVAVAQFNAGWVDVGWSLTLVLLVGWYALWVDGVGWRRAFYLVLAAAWGLRLGVYIFRRLMHEEAEDPRYRELRRAWGMSANRNFFFFFQSQGIANLLLTAPILLLMHNPESRITIFDLLGMLWMLVAVAGETISDKQLAEWKSNPSNAGKTCRNGLWAFSRHPNYFFEWLHWVAYPILGLSLLGTSLASWWALTLLGPVVMLVLLLRYTGIPYTEQQALRSRGDDYRKYQQEVSAFVPWFTKKKDLK